MEKSVSIRGDVEGDKGDAHMQYLEAQYGKRLDALDLNGDGKVDRSEILMFIDKVAAQEKKARYIKLALILSTVLWIVFALTTFGAVSIFSVSSSPPQRRAMCLTLI